MEDLLIHSTLILDHDLDLECSNPGCLQLCVDNGRDALTLVDFDVFNLIVLVSSYRLNEDHHLGKLLLDSCL